MADLILWKDRELKQLKMEMDRMVKDFFRDFGTSVFDEVYGEAVMVDIKEKSDTVVITAQLPGMAAEDLDVAVSPDVLIIGGLRKETLQGEGGRVERSRKFSNRIKLPCRIEPDKVQASYADDLLEIVLPKCSSGTFRKVEIRQSRK